MLTLLQVAYMWLGLWPAQTPHALNRPSTAAVTDNVLVCRYTGKSRRCPLRQRGQTVHRTGAVYGSSAHDSSPLR
jgi:hypothetical protein